MRNEWKVRERDWMGRKRKCGFSLSLSFLFGFARPQSKKWASKYATLISMFRCNVPSSEPKPPPPIHLQLWVCVCALCLAACEKCREKNSFKFNGCLFFGAATTILCWSFRIPVEFMLCVCDGGRARTANASTSRITCANVWIHLCKLQWFLFYKFWRWQRLLDEGKWNIWSWLVMVTATHIWP